MYLMFINNENIEFKKRFISSGNEKIKTMKNISKKMVHHSHDINYMVKLLT